MRRIKVLNVLGAVNRGGIETWLMHMLRALDKQRFQIHFLVHTQTPGTYENEIRQLGGYIHSFTATKNPLHYAHHFRRVLRREGPFDVVHSHLYLFSGFVVRLAAKVGVPVRIAHSHTAPRADRTGPVRSSYERLMKHWIKRNATHCIGISKISAHSLFGDGSDGNLSILPYGLNFKRFLEREDPDRVKARLGIPSERRVIGHIGRFSAVKNHAFLLDVFANLVRQGTDAHLLLVGDGELRPVVQEAAHARGLADRCTFAGPQNDVAPFLYAMDIFVLPSLYEGLGIVALEAQAAGVPVIASTVVPGEIEVINDLVDRVPLSAGVAEWSAAVRQKLGQKHTGTEDAIVLGNSMFALERCVERLGRIYLGQRDVGAIA